MEIIISKNAGTIQISIRPIPCSYQNWANHADRNGASSARGLTRPRSADHLEDPAQAPTACECPIPAMWRPCRAQGATFKHASVHATPKAMQAPSRTPSAVPNITAKKTMTGAVTATPRMAVKRASKVVTHRVSCHTGPQTVAKATGSQSGPYEAWNGPPIVKPSGINVVSANASHGKAKPKKLKTIGMSVSSASVAGRVPTFLRRDSKVPGGK